jgi:hypothetical protein
VQNKTSDVLNRLANAVVIDANRNQVPEKSLIDYEFCFLEFSCPHNCFGFVII